MTNLIKGPLAYKVTWEEEWMERSEIVFAKDATEADSYSYSDGGSNVAERAPEYDQYAQLGYVPLSKLLDDGWWLTCYHCGSTVYEGCEDEETGEYQDYATEGSKVFCSPHCQFSYAKEASESRRQGQQVKAFLNSYHPGITIKSIHTMSSGVSASFIFPGCVSKMGVDWKSAQPYSVFLRPQDADAWYKWKKLR